MQKVASLASYEAQLLLERLKQEAIPARVDAAIDESGLETNDILVEDGFFTRACEIAEAWDTERRENAQKRSGRRCPKCRTYHLEYVQHEGLENVYRCEDCGFEFQIGRR
jgi:hypothetical protein